MEAVLSAIFHKNVELNLTQSGTIFEEVLDNDYTFKISHVGPNKNFDISFGFSTFVPKAHTPFQWCGRESDTVLEKKIHFLTKELRKLGVHINVSSPKWDYYQAVLSRGDSRLTDYLIEVYTLGGKLGNFKKAAKNHGINTDYYALKDYEYSDKLPWEDIIINPGKDFLIEENRRLLKS